MGEPFVAGHGAPFESPEAPTEQDEPPIGGSEKAPHSPHPNPSGRSPTPAAPAPTLAPPHCQSAAHLRTSLATDLDNGLSSDEAAQRRERDGPNRIEGAKGLSIWNIALKQISNSLTLVLVIVMILSVSIEDYIEGGVVAAVILLNLVVG
jgi:P-type Na+/K+ transporter